MSKSIPIPSWEAAQLNALGQEGRLAGVSPQILGVIDLAESSGRGGGVNSEGYGGFFGLSRNDLAIYNEPASALTGTSATAFDDQAIAAAAIFSSLLAEHGGNAYAAEVAYQGGSTEGENLMRQYGISGSVVKGTLVEPNKTVNSTQASNAGWTSVFGDVGGFFASIPGDLANGLSDVAQFTFGWVWTLVMRIILVLVFLVAAWLVLNHAIGGRPDRVIGSGLGSGLKTLRDAFFL